MPLETQTDKINRLEDEIKTIKQQLQQQSDILMQLTDVNAHLLNNSIPTKKDVKQYQRQMEQTQKEYIDQQHIIIRQLSECHQTLQSEVHHLTEQSIQRQLNIILENKRRMKINDMIQSFNQALPGIMSVIGAVAITLFGLWWVLK